MLSLFLKKQQFRKSTLAYTLYQIFTMSQKPNEISDNTIIELIIFHDKKELQGLLYSRYNQKVFYRCLKIVKNRELAKDLTQDIMLKAFSRLSQYQGKSFGMWLNTIAYNYCIDYLRKAKRLYFETYEEEHFQNRAMDGDGILEKIRFEEQLEQLNGFILELKLKDRTFIEMRYRQGLSIKAISEHTGVGESAVKMRLKRAKEKLIEKADMLQAA